MKKTILTIAIILGMTLGTFAQEGGLFGKGPEPNYDSYSYRDGGDQGGLINLPNSHGTGNDQTAPLGSGALLLIGFGAAYALKKKKG